MVFGGITKSLKYARVNVLCVTSSTSGGFRFHCVTVLLLRLFTLINLLALPPRPASSPCLLSPKRAQAYAEEMLSAHERKHRELVTVHQSQVKQPINV